MSAVSDFALCGKFGKAKEELEIYILMIKEVFSDEKNLLKWAKILKDDKKDEGRQSAGQDLIDNHESRHELVSVMKEYLVYLEEQDKKLDQLMAYLPEINETTADKAEKQPALAPREWQAEWGEPDKESMDLARSFMGKWDNPDGSTLRFGVMFNRELTDTGKSVAGKQTLTCFQAICKMNFDLGASILISLYIADHSAVEYILREDYNKPYLWAVIERGAELIKYGGIEQYPRIKCIDNIFAVQYDQFYFMHAYVSGMKKNKKREIILLNNLSDKAVAFIINSLWYNVIYEKSMTSDAFYRYSNRNGSFYETIVKQRPGVIRLLSEGTRNWLKVSLPEETLPSKAVQISL